MKMWKVYRRTDRQTETGDQKSSLVLGSIKSSTIIFVNYNEIYHIFMLPATAYSIDDKRNESNIFSGK